MSADQCILLVEDDPGDVFLMERALKKAHLSNPLRVVSTGQEALDYFSGVEKFADREQYPIPSIVFLDLKLPYVHGFEVLAWIKRQPHLESVVVIVLTSSCEEKDSIKAYELGAQSFLVKPPTAESLLAIFNPLTSNKSESP